MKAIDPEQYTKALGELMEQTYQSKDDAVDAAAEFDTRQTAAEVDISDLQAEVARLNSGKQDALTFDDTPTENSTNPVTSGAVYAALQNVTADEVDWSNVGNKPTTLEGYEVTTDDPLLAGKQDALTFDTTPTEISTNPVTSGGVYTALGVRDTAIDNIRADLTAAEGDITDLTAALADKADSSVVTAALADKADSSAVAAALADKADKTTVTNALAQIQLKANATDLTSKEDKSNRVTTIPQNATDTTYPTAGAVRRLFDSITNFDEVSF